MLYKKLGVVIILQLSQRNGELPLPWKKQGDFPVITVYRHGSVVREFVFKTIFNSDINVSMSISKKIQRYFL